MAKRLTTAVLFLSKAALAFEVKEPEGLYFILNKHLKFGKE